MPSTTITASLALVAACLAVFLGIKGHDLYQRYASEQYGRIVAKDYEIHTRLGERRRVTYEIAFPYCHLVLGPPGALQWLETQRAGETSLPAFLVSWRDARCLSPFQRLGATSYRFFELDTLPSSGREMRAALTATPNASTQLQPRVADVFLDSRGHVYYRVVVPIEAGSGKFVLEPRLLSHLNLVAVLGAWTREVVRRIGAEPLRSTEQCICAAHFGLMGSGLHLSTNRQNICPPTAASPVADSGWVVWLDWQRNHVTTGAGTMPMQQHFYENWHEFPARVDHDLWKRPHGDLIQVNVSTHFSAIDGAAFYDRGWLVARFGAGVVNDHLLPESEGKSTTFDGTEEEHLLRLRLDDPNVPRVSCRPTDGATMEFSRCVAYCDALERHLWRMNQ